MCGGDEQFVARRINHQTNARAIPLDLADFIIESGIAGKMGELGKYRIFSLIVTVSQFVKAPAELILAANRYQALSQIFHHSWRIRHFCLIPLRSEGDNNAKAECQPA